MKNNKALAKRLLKLAAEIDMQQAVTSLGSFYLPTLLGYASTPEQHVLVDKIIELGIAGDAIDDAIVKAIVQLEEPFIKGESHYDDDSKAVNKLFDIYNASAKGKTQIITLLTSLLQIFDIGYMEKLIDYTRRLIVAKQDKITVVHCFECIFENLTQYTNLDSTPLQPMYTRNHVVTHIMEQLVK